MLVILDNGHGGMRKGTYTTCPQPTDDSSTWHKMWKHPGFTLHEGEFNRRLVLKIAELASYEGIDVVILVPELEDVSLQERVNRANSIYERNPDAWLLSIHGNAFNTSAVGFEVFTSKGETLSDPIAETIAINIDNAFPSRAMRWDLSDGDKDKEANFYILRKTKCPAVLTENFFFDELGDATLMNSKEGILRLATAYVNAFKQL